MNELERRTLLGAAGIGALAALSKAGPLNPPAGPVAPTGRTLDEVYDKIAVLPAPGAPGSPGVLSDGRRVISGGATTVLISQPGSYILAGNLAVSSTDSFALAVSATGATIDLNGHTVSNNLGEGIVVGGAARNIVIRNGAVSATGGIRFSQANLEGGVVEDVVLHGCTNYAIQMLGRYGIVRRCVVRRVSGNTGATGISITGDMCSVHDCEVTSTIGDNDPQGLTTYGIRIQGNGSSIARNRVCTLPGVVGTGIRMDGTGVYRDNSVQGYSVNYGIFGGTNGNGNIATL